MNMNETKPVSIYEMPDGKKMIRVKTLDEDFLLDPKHLDNGRWYKFNEAMERLKELGLTTFNKKQAYIMAAYYEKIENAIEILSGDRLDWEWTMSEYNANYAWCFDYCNGTVGNIKYSMCQVRPVYAV